MSDLGLKFDDLSCLSESEVQRRKSLRQTTPVYRQYHRGCPVKQHQQQLQIGDQTAELRDFPTPVKEQTPQQTAVADHAYSEHHVFPKSSHHHDHMGMDYHDGVKKILISNGFHPSYWTPVVDEDDQHR